MGTVGGSEDHRDHQGDDADKGKVNFEKVDGDDSKENHFEKVDGDDSKESHLKSQKQKWAI